MSWKALMSATLRSSEERFVCGDGFQNDMKQLNDSTGCESPRPEAMEHSLFSPGAEAFCTFQLR